MVKYRIPSTDIFDRYVNNKANILTNTQNNNDSFWQNLSETIVCVYGITALLVYKPNSDLILRYNSTIVRTVIMFYGTTTLYKPYTDYVLRYYNTIKK